MNEQEERLRIGARIAELRKAAGLTQQALADKAGLIRTNLVRIETGKYNSSLETLAKVAEGLEKKIDFV